VTQLKAEGLTISVVPGDVGKSTGKAEKAMVLDGHCRWESPVYETVKFLQDVKTGKVNQRIYHLVMSTTVRKIKLSQSYEEISEITFLISFVFAGIYKIWCCRRDFDWFCWLCRCN